MRIFLDTNVFLDALLQRTDSSVFDARLLDVAEEGIVSAFTSSSILATVLYFLKKERHPTENIVITMDRILGFATLVSPTEKTFRQGLYSGFADLEDGVQYYTALQASNLDYFITNNKKDFKAATGLLPVLTPKEFLNL